MPASNCEVKMFHKLRRSDFQDATSRTAEFEGAAFGAGVSFFLVDNDPGEGPSLHQHTYPETWIVHSGEARFTVGTETLVAKSGDIVVVRPETPHMFVNVGSCRLEMVCIHANDRIVNMPAARSEPKE
jgi:mannose-6-phosphate isomerase-like protein (cupin superfamily)